MELHMLNSCAVRFTSVHVITTLFLLTSLFQPAIFANALSNETDRLALLKFKDSIVDDPRGFLNSWNDSLHFCNWYGITCGRQHQRVTTLNLTNTDLHGTISPFIGNLSFLRAFNLSNNSLSGKIPEQVDHLFRLRHLVLDFNMLEGGIPINLTFCRELSIISIQNNGLTGEIPSKIGSLMKLFWLNLQQNSLTGGIPPSLGNLSALTKLSVQQNNLVGGLPEEIGRLRKLYIFHIGANQLSGTIPHSIFNLSSMESFSLPDDAFQGIIPPGVGLNMPHLMDFAIAGNEFSGPIPSSLSNASQLGLIDIADNNFVGQVPTSLGHLQNLRWLSLHGNNLGSYSSKDLEFISSLRNCSYLSILDINSNKFGGVLPKSIANLSTELTRLYMGGNIISGRIPETLSNLNNLIILAMEANVFKGVIPASFGKFQKLQELSLPANLLSGRIPSSLGNLTQLYYVDLSANQFAGTIPPSIGNCLFLKQMYVSENHLSGDIPPQLFGLSSLIYLNLSHNSLTGSFSMEVGKLQTINTLDISGNNLTGEIPETIGGCQSLAFLLLQENFFQGNIPSSLASLRGLQYLDLSGNSLSGQIPKDLQGLPFLIYLNLSANNLEGEVPKEGVFRNTSAISLEGNTKLCGGVPKLQLPACPVKVANQRKLHGLKLKLTITSIAGCFFVLAVVIAFFSRKKTQKQKLLSEVSPINLLSNVSYKTLFEATSGFSQNNQIGSGGFGTVYKGILNQEENNIVAIKVLNLQHEGALKSFMAECNALRNIRHRNLVKILTCCSSADHNGNDFKALIYEYMSNGSLEQWLHRENQSESLSLFQRLNIAVDVASALCYLHHDCEPQIIHRDMKPSNVLLDDVMVARVGDFGLAKLIVDSSQNQSSRSVGIEGTIGYAAPEYASGVKASKQGDVYSYGILVLEMFTGRRPIDDLFKDGLDLHNFVKKAIPGRLVQILDPVLLASIGETSATAATDNEVTNTSGYNHEIEAAAAEEEQHDSENSNAYLWNCIFPILKMGLSCSEVSPLNRMSMKDVLKDLHHIQKAYSTVDIRRERLPRR